MSDLERRLREQLDAASAAAPIPGDLPAGVRRRANRGRLLSSALVAVVASALTVGSMQVVRSFGDSRRSVPVTPPSTCATPEIESTIHPVRLIADGEGVWRIGSKGIEHVVEDGRVDRRVDLASFEGAVVEDMTSMTFDILAVVRTTSCSGDTARVLVTFDRSGEVRSRSKPLDLGVVSGVLRARARGPVSWPMRVNFWLATSGSLMLVAEDGTIARRIAIPADPVDIVEGGDAVWVLDALGRIHRAGVADDESQPFVTTIEMAAMSYWAGWVIAADRDGTLYRIAPATGKPERIPLTQPVRRVIGNLGLVYSSHEGGEPATYLFRVDPDTMQVLIENQPVEGEPLALASDGDAVWIATTKTLRKIVPTWQAASGSPDG